MKNGQFRYSGGLAERNIHLRCVAQRVDTPRPLALTNDSMRAVISRAAMLRHRSAPRTRMRTPSDSFVRSRKRVLIE